MKSLAFMFAALAAFAASAAPSPAATQDWVRHFVATNVGLVGSKYVQELNTTSAVARVAGDYNGNTCTATFVFCDHVALMATNVTPAAVALGVTNGTVWALNDVNLSNECAFVNMTLDDAGLGYFVSSTTNYPGFISPQTRPAQFPPSSVVTNGLDTFEGYFSVIGARIPEPYAKSLVEGY